MHLRVLQEGALVDARLELFSGREVVVHAVLQGMQSELMPHSWSCLPAMSLIGRHVSNADQQRKLTSSPCLGARVVWLQEKPKESEESISCFTRVPLPTPDGPQMTSELGKGLPSPAALPPWDVPGAVPSASAL